MFGYIAADFGAMSKEERVRYAKFYCGLCHQLDVQYGWTGSATLTYDMTFLSILLSALYELDETPGYKRCCRHPFKPRAYVLTEATDYAARMNILLTYYKCRDDWKDDRNPIARARGILLEKRLARIKDAYPLQSGAIAGRLQQLDAMEEANELNPDCPANCFGELMGELFTWRQDEYTDGLRRVGAALGRFVYLLDAANDLKADIKKMRYNPLVAQMETDFTPMLTLIIAECAAEFEKLPVRRDWGILRNHLYTGVWQRYRARYKKGADG
ncbi:MAG: DUF5685 family protein [Clostridiales bacterium]|jgi:hypothetical protein|nr:DUF5685 family protein [Clostridiales bacterium]